MRSRFLVPLLGAFAALFIASFATAPARADDNGLPAFKLCGPTTATGQQCVIPNPNGTITLGGGSGDASAANQASQIVQETAAAAALGTTVDSACGTDTGTCALIALFKRFLQGQTTLNATAAAPGTVSLFGTTTQGATPYGLQTAASTNCTLISTGAHTLKGLHLASSSLTAMYARMYDTAGAPTASSATGFVRTFPIPPAASAGLIGGYEVKLPVEGVKYTTGLSFCITGGPTPTDSTNATTGGFLNAEYN